MIKRLAVATLLFVATTAFAAPQTLTGFVTDTMCGKKHMMPGKNDADCIRECVKAGSKYALLVGDKLYTLSGDAKQIQSLAGRKATVVGELQGSTVALKSIAPAK
jgi:hypothetical protein